MVTSPNADTDAGLAYASRGGRRVKLADPTLALDRVKEYLWATQSSRNAYFDKRYDEHLQHQATMRGLLPLIRDIAERVHPDIAPELQEPDDDGHSEWQWAGPQAAAETLVGVLENQGVHERIFGASGPSLSASGLHEWVWGAAKGRWDDGYYGDAVHEAAEVVSQKTKVKLDRQDLSGVRLYSSAFSPKPPAPGESRLRLPFVDQQDEASWRSAHEGAMYLGMACSQGIRNPQAHKTANQFTEQEALEQLGALSVLARWVDASAHEAADCP